jgi:hypothetical protein
MKVKFLNKVLGLLLLAPIAMGYSAERKNPDPQAIIEMNEKLKKSAEGTLSKFQEQLKKARTEVGKKRAQEEIEKVTKEIASYDSIIAEKKKQLQK